MAVAETPVLGIVPVVVVPVSVPGITTPGRVVITPRLPLGFVTTGLMVTSPVTGAAVPKLTEPESCSMYAVGVVLAVTLAVALTVWLPVTFSVVFTAILFSGTLAMGVP